MSFRFISKAGRDAKVLLALALVPALIAAWVHPHRPTWAAKRPAATEIGLEDAQKLAPPVMWVDARPEAAFREHHVPGAILLNEDRWETLLPGFMAVWRPGVRVIVYCDSSRCGASHDVALRLHRELRIENIFVLHGGWSAWLETKTP